MNQNDKDVLSCLGLIIVAVVTIAISAIANGFVLKTLWAWFVVSTFHVTEISIAQALGIGLIVQFFFYSLKKEERTEKRSTVESLVISTREIFVKAAIFLAFGYIVLQFI